MASPQSSPTLEGNVPRVRTRVQKTAEAFEQGSPKLTSPTSRDSHVEEDLERLKEARRVQIESLRVESAGYRLGSDGGIPSPTGGTPRSHSSQRSIPTTPTTPRTTAPHLAASASSSSFQSPDSMLAQQLAAMSLGDREEPTGKENRNGILRNGSEKGKGRASESEDRMTTPTRMRGESVEDLPESPSTARVGPNGVKRTLRQTQSKDDLQLLVCSAGMTELSMSIQECNTIIFEIQELRHKSTSTAPTESRTPKSSNTSAASQTGAFSPETEYPHSSPSIPPSEGSSGGGTFSDSGSSREGGNHSSSALSQVDTALMKLHNKMDSVRQEFADLESRLSPFFETQSADEDVKSQIEFLQRKWVATMNDWEATQRDADILGDELNEDKWITVFRSVHAQADDMMRSLEKVLKQCHEFIWDLNQRQGEAKANEGPRTPGGRSLGPSNPDPILSKLGVAGIDFQKYLQTFVALHRSLHSKVKYYAPACERVLKVLDRGISDRSTKNGEVLRRFGEMKIRWRNLLERISRLEVDMKGVEDILSDAGSASSNQEPGLLTPPRRGSEGGTAGRASPFRRLANKMGATPSTPPNGSPATSSPSTSPTRKPPPSNLSLSKGRPPPLPTSLSASDLRSTSAAASPPRPPKSTKRAVSGASDAPQATLHRSTRGPPPNASHRYTQSATLHNLFPSSNPSTPIRASNRSVSPAPSADGQKTKPRWNISTKLPSEPRETLRESTIGTSRSSLGNTFDSSRNITPGRHSVMGLRSSSRMSGTLGRSMNGARAVSPAFSNFSDGSTSFVRERPHTPNSRIPLPASAGRQRSTTPFSSLEDPEPTSLLQRAMSPTTSTSSQLLSVSPTTTRSPSRQSRLPTRATSPSPSNVSSSVYYNRGGQTPEPSLIAQAQRMRNIRMPGSRPPPVPSIPANLRDSTATPRAGLRRPSHSSRPPSALSNRTDGVTSPTMYNQPAPPQPYSPNHLDPLDVEVAAVVNILPLLLRVERLDPPLTRSAAAQAAGFSARYFLSLGALDHRRACMLKLVDRVGPRATKGAKKVLVRVGGGWQELEPYAMSLLASSL